MIDPHANDADARDRHAVTTVPPSSS